MRIPWSAGVISDAALIGRKDSCNDLYQLLHTLSYSTDFPDNTGWTEVDSGSNVDLSSGIWSFNGNGSFNANGIYKNTPIAISGRGGYVEFKARIPIVALGGECLIRSVSGLPTALTGQTGLTVASTVLRNYYAGAQANGVTIRGDIWYTIRIYVTKDGTSIYDLRHTIQDDTVYLTETEFLSLYQAVNIGEWYFNIQRRTNSAGALLQFKEYREYFGGYSVAAPYVTYACDAGADKYINGLDFTSLALPSGVSDTNLEFDYSFDDGTPSYSSKYSLTNLQALGSISGTHRYLRIRVYANSNGETQAYIASVNADDAIVSIQAASEGDLVAPVISESYAFADSVKINIYPNKNWNTLEIYRDDVKIADATNFTYYIDTSVAADTEYVYTAKALNTTGGSATSNAITITTPLSDIPIEQRIYDGICEAINDMAAADGYLQDWSDLTNIRDEAQIDAYPAAVKVECKAEDNEDDNGGADYETYNNIMTVTIKTVDRLSSEPTNPIDAANVLTSRMLHDLKRLFGINYSINAGCDAEFIQYVGSEVEETVTKDVFQAVNLISTWKVRYRQRRTNPLINSI